MERYFRFLSVQLQCDPRSLKSTPRQDTSYRGSPLGHTISTPWTVFSRLEPLNILPGNRAVEAANPLKFM